MSSLEEPRTAARTSDRLELARYVASVGLCASLGFTILFLVIGLGSLPFTFRSASDHSNYRAAVHSLLWIWLMPCAQMYAIVALIKRWRMHCAGAVMLLSVGSAGYEIGIRTQNGRPPGWASPEVLTGLVPDLLVMSALGYLIGQRAWWAADKSSRTWQDWLFVVALPVVGLSIVVTLAGGLLLGLADLNAYWAVLLLAGPLIAARFYRKDLAPDTPRLIRTLGLVLLLVAQLPVIAVRSYGDARTSSRYQAIDFSPPVISLITCGVGVLVMGCVLLLGFRARRKEPEPHR